MLYDAPIWVNVLLVVLYLLTLPALFLGFLAFYVIIRLLVARLRGKDIDIVAIIPAPLSRFYHNFFK